MAVIDEQCNRISDVVVVSGSEDLTPHSRAGYSIGPNPVSNKLSLFINNDYKGEVNVSLYDVRGSNKVLDAFIKKFKQVVSYIPLKC